MNSILVLVNGLNGFEMSSPYSRAEFIAGIIEQPDSDVSFIRNSDLDKGIVCRREIDTESFTMILRYTILN